MIKLALYQPDIPQNTGAAMRLCACLGAELDIIEPCGFVWNDRKIRQSGLDYTESVAIQRHRSWPDFLGIHQGQRRIILLTTKTDTAYTDFSFAPNDILLMGRESAGVPDDVHSSADACLTIPMPGGGRSLNVINAAAMVMGEALRQTRNLQHDSTSKITAAS